MPGKVADASLLAAVAFGEPGAANAVDLIRDADLYEPPLLAYELASVARKKISSNPEQRDGVIQGLQAILRLDIRWVDQDHQQIIDLALDSGLSTYDASYLHLARALGIPIATFDQKMRAAAEALGVEL